MESGSELIPLRCRTCPHILPALEALRDLESQKFALDNFPEIAAEYADQADIDSRRSAIDEDIEAKHRELKLLHVRTIGCKGVVLAQARLDDEDRIDNISCGSIFNFGDNQ